MLKAAAFEAAYNDPQAGHNSAHVLCRSAHRPESPPAMILAVQEDAMTADRTAPASRRSQRRRWRLADRLLAAGSAVLFATSLAIMATTPRLEVIEPVAQPTLGKAHVAAYSLAARLELLR
jgi:hypothetical protein